MTNEQDMMVHDYEAACGLCYVARPYDASVPDCVQPECSDSATAEAAAQALVDAGCEADGGQGSCCRNDAEIAAFRTVLSYHDLCDHDDVPQLVEMAKHDFGIACEDSGCNLGDADYDGTVCPPEWSFEWAGVFAVSQATSTWSMQADPDGQYPDESMRLVLFPADTPDDATMDSLMDAADALMEGDCTVVEDGETMTAPAADGSCFELHVGSGVDSTYSMVTAGMSGIAIFAQHVPIEFERDAHYFYDATGDIEPIAEESPSGGGHGHAHGHSHGQLEICACAAEEADH